MTKHCSKRAVGEGENGVVRLFGVRLNDGSFIKKSASMGNILSHEYSGTGDSPGGYHSDDPAHGRRAQRKKAIPWTEEEHRQFLVGLQMLGKGDWRGISKTYVPSKTPSQVASHAQKYFIRQNNTSKKKRRSSLFDLVPDLETSPSSMPEQFKVLPVAEVIENEKLVSSSSQEADIVNPQLSLDLSLKPIFMPSPFQLWPQASSSSKDEKAGTSHHQILTQIPDVSKEPEKELIGISGLTLGDNEAVRFELTQLSLRQPLES